MNFFKKQKMPKFQDTEWSEKAVSLFFPGENLKRNWDYFDLFHQFNSNKDFIGMTKEEIVKEVIKYQVPLNPRLQKALEDGKDIFNATIRFSQSSIGSEFWFVKVILAIEIII